MSRRHQSPHFAILERTHDTIIPAPHDPEHLQLHVNPQELTLEPSAPVVSCRQSPIPTSTASFIPSEVQTSSVDYMDVFRSGVYIIVNTLVAIAAFVYL